MNKKTSSSGLSLWGVLLVIFVVLKLTNLIDWSWIWVLCPLWIPCLILTTIILLGFLGLISLAAIKIIFGINKKQIKKENY